MKKQKQVGSKEFRKVFARNAFKDTWGVDSVYALGAWRVWQAAIRHARKRSVSEEGSR